MSYRILSLTLALLIAPVSARAADAENPFKAAKKGDFAAYKMTTSAGGMSFEGTLKQTVTAKDDKSATLSAVANVMGMDQPAQETKIDLTKPFDPASSGIPGGKAKVEKLDSGKETIEIGGKKYECEWIKNKVVAEVNGMKFETETKVWTSKKVPLGGMVKMEMKNDMFSMKMELTEFGSGK